MFARITFNGGNSTNFLIEELQRTVSRKKKPTLPKIRPRRDNQVKCVRCHFNYFNAKIVLSHLSLNPRNPLSDYERVSH